MLLEYATLVPTLKQALDLTGNLVYDIIIAGLQTVNGPAHKAVCFAPVSSFLSGLTVDKGKVVL